MPEQKVKDLLTQVEYIKMNYADAEFSLGVMRKGIHDLEQEINNILNPQEEKMPF